MEMDGDGHRMPVCGIGDMILWSQKTNGEWQLNLKQLQNKCRTYKYQLNKMYKKCLELKRIRRFGFTDLCKRQQVHCPYIVQLKNLFKIWLTYWLLLIFSDFWWFLVFLSICFLSKYSDYCTPQMAAPVEDWHRSLTLMETLARVSRLPEKYFCGAAFRHHIV